MEEVVLIGAINAGVIPKGGEEYKNQELASFLAKKVKLTTIDTINWKKNPLVFFQILFAIYISRTKNIWISTSSASAYLLFRFLYFLPCHKSKKISYLVIGGYFSQAVLEKKYHARYYHHLFKIVVEGDKMIQELELVGLKNIVTIPNFKNFDYIPTKKLFNENNKLNFVFLSRIAESKGVLHLLEVSKTLNELGYGGKYSIDFWGPIESAFKLKFKEEINLIENITYKGVLNLQDSKNYSILEEYNAMLFPTFWKGEGFPGVIIDSYIAGIPVIASDWNMNKEVIENKITGYLYSPNQINELTLLILDAINNPHILNNMRTSCALKAKQFHVNQVITNKLIPELLGI